MASAALRPMPEEPSSVRFTKDLALDQDRNRLYSRRMRRDAKQALVGLASLLVFGIALVVWPALAFIYTMPFKPHSI
jgi:hypothetical protein